MPLPLLDVLLTLPAYVLVLFRLSGLMITAPLFNSSIVPIRLRAAFAIVLAAMILPVVGDQAPAELTLAHAIAGGVAEMMVGATIGLSLSILISVGQVAGTLIGQQGGFALSEVINPFQDEGSSVIDQIYMIAVTLVFLYVGGHRASVAAVLDTYAAVPMLSHRPDESAVLLLVEAISAAFVVGIRVAGPVVLALFLTEAGLGLMSRTVPQLNILTVGFTVRTFMVLAAAAFSLPACQDVLLDAVWDGLEAVRLSFG
jgi:flagellar biosynthetic protein FliR